MIMTELSDLTYADLDWDLLRHNAHAQKCWASKGPKDWDQKSSSFASRNSSSPYVASLLAHLPLQPDMTVLDVGSGPGTLALPIAAQVRSVCAIDFAPNMLKILNTSAESQGIANIRTIECAWEDDWEAKDVGCHDLVLASRSMSVANLRQALDKLNRHARRFVFIADRISPTPFDPEVFAALGRPFNAGPDYIYTVNTLYTMAIHPHITILELDQDNRFANLDDAQRSYSWMFKDLTPTEEGRLRAYLLKKSQPTTDGGISIRRSSPPRWALIWWEKNQAEQLPA